MEGKSPLLDISVAVEEPLRGIPGRGGCDGGSDFFLLGIENDPPSMAFVERDRLRKAARIYSIKTA